MIFYVIQSFNSDAVALLECFVTILLTVLFFCTLCWFLQTLQANNIRSTLSKEKRIVRFYFYSFSTGFGAKTVYSFYWYITTKDANLSLNFKTAVANLCVQILFNVVPIAVVLYMHHKIFGGRQSNRLSGSTDSVGEDQSNEVTIDPKDFHCETEAEIHTPDSNTSAGPMTTNIVISTNLNATVVSP